MPNIIKPTVGRKVWFFENAQHALRHLAGDHQAQPYDATVTFVHDDRTVNVRVCDHNGVQNMGLGIALRQDGDPPLNGPHCQWMPYQQAQQDKAAKSEETLLDLSQSSFTTALPVNLGGSPEDAVKDAALLSGTHDENADLKTPAPTDDSQKVDSPGTPL